MTELFDRSRLQLRRLQHRTHDLALTHVLPLQSVPVMEHALHAVAAAIKTAHTQNAKVVLMMGAHVLRSGVQRYLVDMMERGAIDLIAMNGGAMIHDYELSLIGATTESVARYIAEGQFGLWKETGRINHIVKTGAKQGLGLGECVGKTIEEEDFPHKECSILAAGFRLGIPITVHVGIGYDIVHEHPNCDGSAYGKTSYHDFLAYAHVIQELQNGVVMNFGSAVMAPEVFLKALAMARNVARCQETTYFQVHYARLRPPLSTY